MISISKDSLPNYKAGENGIKNPKIVKAGIPVKKPNTGIQAIIPGVSHCPQTNDEILKQIQPVKTKIPISLNQGDEAFPAEMDYIFSKEHSKLVIPPRVFYPGKELMSQPKIVNVSSLQKSSQNNNYSSNTRNDSLKPPKIIKVNNPIIKHSLPPRYKDNAIANLKYYDIEQGMISSYVMSIFEDKNGNIWIGTWGGGLSKFDGETFTHFTTKQGLSNNYVLSIIEDKYGNIWFGTDGGGVNRFDGESFTHFTTEQGLSNNYVLTVFEDSKGNLWFGTDGGGLNKLEEGKKNKSNDFKNQSANYVITQFTTSQGLSNNVVLSAFEDKKGNLWFGTNGGGVSCFNGNAFTHFTTEQGLINNIVYAISEDKLGNIWFGTEAGLCSYNTNPEDSININSNHTFTHFSTDQGLINNVVLSIIADKSGNIWFSTYNGGVSRFDGEAFTHFTIEHGLSNNVVLTILEDKSGSLWFGTDGGGINKYSGETHTHFTTKQGLSSNIIWSILEDKSGNLWFGTADNGVTKYDGENFLNYTTSQGLSDNSLRSILEDKNGNIWFGTLQGGLCKYNGESFSIYKTEQGLSNNGILSMLEDTKGNIWVGTNGGGINYFDGEKFSHLTTNQGLTNDVVFSIFEDKNGAIWFGTSGGGISRYDGNNLVNFTTKQGLSNNKVKRFYEDKYGNIWIATSDKVTILTYDYIQKYFNNKSNSLSQKEGIYYLSTEQGLFSNLIMSITDDKSGNIWIGSENGPIRLSFIETASNLKNKDAEQLLGMSASNILLIDSAYYKVKNYSVHEGFIGGDVYSNNSVCEDSKGNIWWGSGKMLTKYNPNFDFVDTTKPMIHFKNIRLFFETIDWSNITGVVSENSSDLIIPSGIDFDSLTKWHKIPVNLSLAYDQNHITFDFIGINWTRPDKILYKYILEGVDKEWSPLTNKTEATFSNLSHGKYSFKVKAVSNDNIWSETLTYNFVIKPPWWLTWWFKLIYISSAVLALFIFYRWRTATLRKRQKQLVYEVRKATMEIREKNEILNQRNEEIISQKDEIESQRNLVVEQKEHLEEIHREITDSINYAKQIQTSTLPDLNLLKNSITDFFILFKPKDVVSGDFYWFAEEEDKIIIAVADCTGHGVPGAFMSMLGIGILKEIVVREKITQTDQILNELRIEVIKALSQTGASSKNSSSSKTLRDGMDLSLCIIHKKSNILQWSGANNPCMLIQNGEFTEIKADKMPIAFYEKMDKFSVHEIPLKKGDIIYLTTDGFIDQFGGPNGRKFMSKRLKELLVEISPKPMNEQNEILDKTILDWMNGYYEHYEQTDDITIMGIKI
ncbi:MAG: SpoIIE family protein phosphatase [Bacteroidales bacterium]|nr:SpoIIE family protein phosphatase [Bacteroidales bacterium]